MKFIVVLALIAVAFCTAGDLSSPALTASFKNTSSKAADGYCQFTFTGTLATLTADINLHLWLMNSKTQHSVLVNDTIIYVKNAVTFSGLTTVTTGASYVATSAITITTSDTVTSSNTVSGGTIATNGGVVTTTSLTFNMNATYTQFQYLNASTTSQGSFFVYWSYVSADVYTDVQTTGYAIGTTAISVSSWSTCTAGYKALASGSTSIVERLIGSILALSFF